MLKFIPDKFSPGSAITFLHFPLLLQAEISKELTRIEPGSGSVTQHIRVPRPMAHGAKGAPCSNLFQTNLVQVRPPLFYIFPYCYKLKFQKN